MILEQIFQTFPGRKGHQVQTRWYGVTVQPNRKRDQIPVQTVFLTVPWLLKTVGYQYHEKRQATAMGRASLSC